MAMNEGQPKYSWQGELDKMRSEGRPLEDQAMFLSGKARLLQIDPNSGVGGDEYLLLMNETLSILDEGSLKMGINPLIGLRTDVDRVELALGIIDRLYGANPQEVIERKKSLLDNAYEAIQRAHDRVLGLYPQHSVPFRVPFRQSEQERH